MKNNYNDIYIKSLVSLALKKVYKKYDKGHIILGWKYENDDVYFTMLNRLDNYSLVDNSVYKFSSIFFQNYNMNNIHKASKNVLESYIEISPYFKPVEHNPEIIIGNQRPY